MKKEPEIDSNGQEVMKCGFKIGGGIDQDYQKSPQGYTDNVSICVIIFEICTTCKYFTTKKFNLIYELKCTQE